MTSRLSLSSSVHACMIVYRIIFMELLINRTIEVLYCVQVHVCGFIKS